MSQQNPRVLSAVLDQLDQLAQGDSVSVEDVIETLGHRSFASLMLVFSLISTSPASAIPGMTTGVAGIVFILVVQMIVGRDSVWLPEIIIRQRMSGARLRQGVGWLRRPAGYVDRLLRERFTALFHRPWLWLPLVLIMGLTMFMPFMEFIPTSGSIASAVIALFAAGLLARDGGLVLASFALLLAIPLAIWHVGFGS